MLEVNFKLQFTHHSKEVNWLLQTVSKTEDNTAIAASEIYQYATDRAVFSPEGFLAFRSSPMERFLVRNW